jgi:hypothetical protein
MTLNLELENIKIECGLPKHLNLTNKNLIIYDRSHNIKLTWFTIKSAYQNKSLINMKYKHTIVFTKNK